MTHRSSLIAAGIALSALTLTSVAIGAGDLPFARLVSGDLSADDLQLLLVSRLPRSFALLLAGAGLAVAGLIMQTLTSNRFVEPSTVGVTESAALGMLGTALLAPSMPVFGKMLVAAAAGLAGAGLFMAILARLKLRSSLLVPLVGLILAGILQAAAQFIAYRFDLMQSLGALS